MITNALLLTIRFTKPGEFKQAKGIDLSSVSTAQPGILSVKRRVFPKVPALDKLTNLDQTVRRRISGLTAAASDYAPGLYFVMPTKMETLTELLNTWYTERCELTDQLVAEVGFKLEDMREMSGDQWDEKNYPTEAQIRNDCTMKWAWTIFSTPSEADGLKAEMVQEVNHKAKDLIESITGQMREQLRTEFLEMVEHLKERLTPDSDGKTKIFKQNSLANIVEFLDNFKDRNFAEDSELEDIVERAKGLFSGVSAGDLREDAKQREGFNEALGQLIAGVSEEAVERKRRDIIL